MALASPELVGILETEEEVIVVSDVPENVSRTKVGMMGQGTEISPSAQAPANGGGSVSQEAAKTGGTQASSASDRSESAVQTGEGQPQGENTQEVTVDAEAATLAEKAKAYKLASSKLSAKEINALIQWSQGGFTQEEKESAKSLFYSRFTADEQQWILRLFRKYGQ